VAEEVLTPISQAMKDGVLTRKELKKLMTRSNGPGLFHLLIFMLCYCVTGLLILLTKESLWMIPAMFLHGIILVHHFSLQHECCHYTPFKTRWLNEIIGAYCGFVLVIPNKFFRYEHCNHHTYTQILGKDPELIELPISLWKYLWYVSSIPYWKAKFSELFNHTLGRISEVEKEFIPTEERSSVILEARLYSLGYAIIILASWYGDWWGVIWYWWLPVFIGEPVMRAIRMAEHVGRPNITDMKQNTRTSLVSFPMRFLCWNMNYHAEHHYASSIPFHALPKLHKKLEGFVHVERRGYWGAHFDIISQIVEFKPRSDKIKNQN